MKVGPTLGLGLGPTVGSGVGPLFTGSKLKVGWGVGAGDGIIMSLADTMLGAVVVTMGIGVGMGLGT